MNAPGRQAAPGGLLPALGVLVTTALATALAAVLAAGPITGGIAAWGASTQRISAPISRAMVGHTFTPRGTGTGGAGYTSASLLDLDGAVALVDLVSTSTVPVTLTGTMRTTNLAVPTRVTIRGCSAPWAGTTCPATTWTVLSDVAIDARRTLTWTPTPLPARGTAHLRVSVSSQVGNAVRFTATPTTRPPADRTRA